MVLKFAFSTQKYNLKKIFEISISVENTWQCKVRRLQNYGSWKLVESLKGRGNSNFMDKSWCYLSRRVFQTHSVFERHKLFVTDTEYTDCLWRTQTGCDRWRVYLTHRDCDRHRLPVIDRDCLLQTKLDTSYLFTKYKINQINHEYCLLQISKKKIYTSRATLRCSAHLM